MNEIEYGVFDLLTVLPPKIWQQLIGRVDARVFVDNELVDIHVDQHESGVRVWVPIGVAEKMMAVSVTLTPSGKLVAERLGVSNEVVSRSFTVLSRVLGVKSNDLKELQKRTARRRGQKEASKRQLTASQRCECRAALAKPEPLKLPSPPKKSKRLPLWIKLCPYGLSFASGLLLVNSFVKPGIGAWLASLAGFAVILKDEHHAG